MVIYLLEDLHSWHSIKFYVVICRNLRGDLLAGVWSPIDDTPKNEISMQESPYWGKKLSLFLHMLVSQLR